MALAITTDNNLFRLQGQAFCRDWVLDTPANRKALVVFLRLLRDSDGNPLYTHQELALVVDSGNRQAASNHFESFLACGRDAFLSRKRKVNSRVVDAVLTELLDDPLRKISALTVRVNQRLGRTDLSEANINTALESISIKQIRPELLRRLENGLAHYKEDYRLSEMMSELSSRPVTAAVSSGIVSSGIVSSVAVIGSDISPCDDGMQLSDPTAIRALLTDPTTNENATTNEANTALTTIATPLKWVCFMMALYYHGVSLALLGKWCHVHKTTVLRWIMSLSLCLWPIVYCWIKQQVKGNIVSLDEKWLKIKGQWHYWFVVLDKESGLPLVTSLLASKSKWSIEWIGIKLKRLKKMPRVLITDGMLGYDCLLKLDQRIKHILCHFHHQKGIIRYLKQRCQEKQISEKQLPALKQEMKKVLQTKDKRTVKRRLAKLKEMKIGKCQLAIQQWLSDTEKKLSQLLPSVGSKRIPRTNNAIERFFRAFNRFYQSKSGFSTVASAKRELIFFLLMYLFVKQPSTAKAPIEKIMPQAKNMPFYQLVNDPIMILMKPDGVKQKENMAAFRTQTKLLDQV